MENNKIKAVLEELGQEVDETAAKRLFYHLYEYILYNNPQGFLEVLDYRINLKTLNKPNEDYYMLKFMLQQMKDFNPSKLSSLVRN